MERRLPVFSGGCTIGSLKKHKLDIRKGTIGDQLVDVLRDTGCELAAV